MQRTPGDVDAEKQLINFCTSSSTKELFIVPAVLLALCIHSFHSLHFTASEIKASLRRAAENVLPFSVRVRSSSVRRGTTEERENTLRPSAILTFRLLISGGRGTKEIRRSLTLPTTPNDYGISRLARLFTISAFFLSFPTPRRRKFTIHLRALYLSVCDSRP